MSVAAGMLLASFAPVGAKGRPAGDRSPDTSSKRVSDTTSKRVSDTTSPEIRLSTTNRVPACATPERLMSFLKSRNGGLDERYADIAKLYKHYGEAWRVRWDYAVFQMAVETNSLRFRRDDGSAGDVKPKQNNFAGIGTTGGGVPGDSFPDVKTGVLAHIQHLVAYSGEKLAAPVAPRTQLKQADIVEASLGLNRPVRFADLARRWATDAKYWRSIETLAESYRVQFCTSPEPVEAAAPVLKAPPRPMLAARPKAQAAAAPKPAAPAAPAASAVKTVWRDGGAADAGSAAKVANPSAAAAPAGNAEPSASAAEPSASCSIATASYGGSKTLLIKAQAGGRTSFTALGVLEGFEDAMAQSFIRTHAPGGASIGSYASRADAVAKARSLCAGGA